MLPNGCRARHQRRLFGSPIPNLNQAGEGIRVSCIEKNRLSHQDSGEMQKRNVPKLCIILSLAQFVNLGSLFSEQPSRYSKYIAIN
jgi:hypothetical protein